ncbi:hypothetical protein IC229_05865 [Spirosoma sp. BT702]|uniref:Dystroglycan-type cadherin-like domain-containing protein n=1 Tax=Spirosoma profusum TaxID=2771354 RepID=A0A927ATG4_9BACT|nr:putative Ig domain-containing protein [Spirosoma profusum]MBD2700152.1 hypothetical protein [Spirosoma profusum]
MPVTLFTTPDEFALTRGGRMLYEFSGSGRYETLGVKAVSGIGFGGAVPDGTAITLKWNNKSHTITAKTSPVLDSEFPAGDGSIAYADSLVPFFKSYFPFREDFTIDRQELGGFHFINFTAKKPGPAYDIKPITPGNIASPYYFFGNPTPGADPRLRTQYSVYVELYLQKTGTAGTDLDADYERIYAFPIETDAGGNAQFDAGSVLHAHLSADWPSWSLFTPCLAENSARKYYIAYGEAFGAPLQIGRLTNGELYQAYLGGADYLSRSDTGFNLGIFKDIATPAGDRALRYGATTRYVRADEPQFLTFLNFRTNQTGTRLRIIRTYDNNETEDLTSGLATDDVLKGQKITYAVGPTQLLVTENLPTGRSLVDYTVQWLNGNEDPISEAYRFILNYDYQPYTRYFIYLSSLGVPESLCTSGKGSAELNRFYEQAERYLPANYAIKDGQFVDYDIALQDSFEVTTGFRSESELRIWRDFYRSPERYLFEQGLLIGNSRIKPIGITTKPIKLAKDGDTLFAHKFEFVYLYKDEFYSEEQEPAGALPPLNFVPAGNSTVVIGNPTIVRSIDDTVPNAVRDLTTNLINNFKQAVAWGNHALAGYLTESSVSALFRRKDQPITYAELEGTPPTPTLDLVVGQNGITDKTVQVGQLRIPDDSPSTVMDGWAGFVRIGNVLKLAPIDAKSLVMKLVNAITNNGDIRAIFTQVLPQKLSDLIELVSTLPILLKGDATNFTRIISRTSSALAGLTINTDDNFELLGFIGRFFGNAIGMQGPQGRTFKLVGDGTAVTDVIALQATGTDILAHAYVLSELENGSEPTGFFFPKPIGNGLFKLVLADPATVTRALIDYLPASNGSGGSQVRQTRLMGCAPVPKLPQKKQRITLAQASFDADQAHNIQVPGGSITWSLRDPDGKPVGDILDMSFPDAGHFRPSIPAGSLMTKADFVGYKLYLELDEEDFGDVPGWPGAGTYNAFIRGIVDPSTGQLIEDNFGDPILYYSPMDWVERGYDPSEVQIRDWKQYLLPQSTISDECLPNSNPPPPPGYPTWIRSTLNPPTSPANSYFDITLFWDEYGTPAAGKQVAGIDHLDLPPWMTYSTDAPSRSSRIFGKPDTLIPTGITSFSVTMALNQNDGLFTPRKFIQTVVPAQLQVHAIYNTVTNAIDVYVGVDGTGFPKIQLYDAPFVYGNREEKSMPRITMVVLSAKNYFFKYSYGGIITGKYVPKITWLNQVVYVVIPVNENANLNTALSLSLNPPTIQTNFGQEPGEVELLPANQKPIVITPWPDQVFTQISTVRRFAYNPALVFSDPDGDPLEYEFLGLSSGASVPDNMYWDEAAGEFVLPANFVGAAGLMFEAKDPSGEIARSAFLLLVSAAVPTNHAPVLVNPIADIVRARSASAQNVTIPTNTFSDPDSGDTITLTAKLKNGNPLPAGWSFTGNTLTYPLQFAGVQEIAITATDSHGLSVSDDFKITVVTPQLLKIGWFANSRGSGGSFDSIGVATKLSVVPFTYKVYLESETVRGTLELYATVNQAAATNVTVGGVLSDYNSVPIGANGTRIWRDKNYQIKIEILVGTTLVDTQTFTLGLDANTAIASLINVYTAP